MSDPVRNEREELRAQTLGQWLKARREELGLTLRDVERICEGKVSNAAISQVENGRIENPSIGLIVNLAAAYGLMPSEVWEHARTGNEPLTPEICPTCGQMTNNSIRRTDHGQ